MRNHMRGFALLAAMLCAALSFVLFGALNSLTVPAGAQPSTRAAPAPPTIAPAVTPHLPRFH